MRNMSFMLTTEQIRNRTKTVTRRVGWWNLKPGDLIQAVVKGMGLKNGDKVERLAVIRVVSVNREQLRSIEKYPDDCRKEGFPKMTPLEFVVFFGRTHGMVDALQYVNRIEFEYV